MAVLKSFGVTGGADAKNLDDNKRAHIKGKKHCLLSVELTFESIFMCIYREPVSYFAFTEFDH